MDVAFGAAAVDVDFEGGAGVVEGAGDGAVWSFDEAVARVRDCAQLVELVLRAQARVVCAPRWRVRPSTSMVPAAG